MFKACALAKVKQKNFQFKHMVMARARKFTRKSSATYTMCKSKQKEPTRYGTAWLTLSPDLGWMDSTRLKLSNQPGLPTTSKMIIFLKQSENPSSRQCRQNKLFEEHRMIQNTALSIVHT